MKERETHPAFLWTDRNTFIEGEVIKGKETNQWDFVMSERNFPFLTKKSIIGAKDILVDMSKTRYAKEEGDQEWYPE